MPSRETRPISERRTDLSPGRDITRRLIFLCVILSGVGGAFLIIFGISKSRPPYAIGGGLLLVAAMIVWWRARSLVAATSAEIGQNPFKPKNEPEE